MKLNASAFAAPAPSAAPAKSLAAHAACAALAVVCQMTVAPAAAEGALAIGIAPGGVAKGYATGFSINQPNAKTARSSAVEQCKRTRSSNDEARSGCEVIVTFRNKCIASALDPQKGTPGAGWGLGPSEEAADELALARCRVKAGPERADSCKVTDHFCDGW